jgi:hypothetical protein
VISFTCIKSKIELIGKDIIEVLNNSSQKKCKIEKFPDGNIENVLPLEYNPKNLKILLWEPKLKPGSTVFVSNLIDGSDSLINILSNKYDKETYKIFITIDNKVKYPAYLFSYKRNNFERSVRAAFEDKWIFSQKGIPLPTEDKGVYKKKKIKDRVNRQVITSILNREGWDIEDGLFWKPMSGLTSILLNYRD